MPKQLTASNWMDQPVILLNVTFEALEEIPADRAVVLLLSGDAEMVQPHPTGFRVHSKHLSLELPSVIRLNRYVMVNYQERIVDEHSRASFPAVLRRDKHQCGYCGEFAATVDHILPKSRGGTENWHNTIAACSSCNNRKADRTPEEAGMKLLWAPKVPSYDKKRQKQIWKIVESVDVA